MNQLQLNVDVHFVVEDDGRTILLVGGLALPFNVAKLPEVLSSASLKQGRRPYTKRAVKEPAVKAKVKLRVVKGGAGTRTQKSPEWIANIAKANRKRVRERQAKNLCLRCENKPKEGMKLCEGCIAKTARATTAGRKRAA